MQSANSLRLPRMRVRARSLKAVFRPAFRAVFRFVLLAGVSAVLGGCALLRDDPLESWPDNIPPANYFVSAYEQDAENQRVQTLREYLYWVRSFYAGTALYPRGWNSITADVLAQNTNIAKQASRRQELQTLGRNIAREWSKDSSLSLVQSRHLAVWGVAASRSVDEGNIDETLKKIERDLDLLIAREMSADAIVADRYHPDDPDDYFAL